MSTARAYFSIPSNSGRVTTKLDLTRTHESALAFRVSLHSDFWERTTDVLGDQVPQYDVVLHQVMVASGKLYALTQAILLWLENRSPFQLQLAASADQSLSITVDPSETFVSSREKPVFRLAFDGTPTFAVEWSYAVDQSCLRIMLDELDAVLQGLLHLGGEPVRG